MAYRRDALERLGLEAIDLEAVIREKPAIEDRTLAETLAGEGIGYTALLRAHQGHELATVLQDVGITPFTEDSVKVYKARQVRKMDNQVANLVNNVTGVAGLVCAAGAIFSFFIAAVTKGDPGGVSYIALIALVAFVVTGVVSWIANAISENFTTMYMWWETSISSYRAPIPEPILRSVALLATRLPQATFKIDALVNNPDPFLVVEYGDQRFYIGVWDEPDFKAESLA